MKTTATIRSYVCSVLLLSFATFSCNAAVSLSSLGVPVTNGKIIKSFLVTPTLQELLRGKTEDKNLIEQGPFSLSLHDITNLITACAVNCLWSAHANKDDREMAEVIKATCLGECAYKGLVTLGKLVGFNQSLSEDMRKRVTVFVAPFLKEVLAEVVHEMLQQQS